MLGLGLLANGLRTGKYRVWTAVVLSLAAVSHGIVLIFVAVARDDHLAWSGSTSTRPRVRRHAGITTVLLSAWWVGPFLFGHEFMTDMKYGFRPNSSTDSFWDMYFPLTPALDIMITALAVVGFSCVRDAPPTHRRGDRPDLPRARRRRLFARDSLPVIGLLWNPRLLPFFYLMRYLLMVVGALEVVAWVVNADRQRRAQRAPRRVRGRRGVRR